MRKMQKMMVMFHHETEKALREERRKAARIARQRWHELAHEHKRNGGRKHHLHGAEMASAIRALDLAVNDRRLDA